MNYYFKKNILQMFPTSFENGRGNEFKVQQERSRLDIKNCRSVKSCNWLLENTVKSPLLGELVECGGWPFASKGWPISRPEDTT